MAIQVFTNAIVLLDGYNISGDLNQVVFDFGAETPDATVFGLSSRTYKGGLFTIRVSMKGFVKWDADSVGHAMWDRVGVDDTILTLFHTNPTEGTTEGWSLKVVQGSFVPNITEGEIHSFDMVAEGRAVV